MIKSMTGYGKGRAGSEGGSLTVEIKSVNHRYCEIGVKAPRFLLAWEAEVRKRIGERLKRGKIDVFINQEFSDAGAVVPMLNRPLAAAYVELFGQMRREFSLSGEIPLGLLASQKDVVLLRESEPDEDRARTLLGEALAVALDQLEKMRQAEGEATLQDLQSRIDLLEEMLGRIEARSALVPREWQEKLKERLARLTGELEVDPQRLAQELALFADRCDISEELSRFRSHLQQFRALFQTAEPVGRQMDFLVQELNRETNTMGSKSNEAELTRLVVAIKAELERIREQVQNIE
jgi:uncharacterized protein (TIGR00255 family)